MNRLGYTRYVAQGGDVGAAVTDLMSRQAPDGLLGVHTNLLVPVLGIADQLPAESEQERAALAAFAEFRESGFGYFLEMATRPQNPATKPPTTTMLPTTPEAPSPPPSSVTMTSPPPTHRPRRRRCKR